MTEHECLVKMIAPGTPRKGKYRDGVIQILVTSSCDKACFGCTQGSQLRRKPWFMTPLQFERAIRSLMDSDPPYFGVVGVFGGNPAIHPHFDELCCIMRRLVPYEQRGIWCNNPLGKGTIMRQTFNPAVSNLNVHLDERAYKEFKQDWPECNPVGLKQDSRHSPPWVAMRDVITLRDEDEGGEERRRELIARCDINQHWSAGIGVFRGELRAWFCEVAMAQSILHQDDPDYPDTGLDPLIPYIWYNKQHKNPNIDMSEGAPRYDPIKWWQLPIHAFRHQVRKHCHECSIPLRGYGELAMAGTGGVEQVSETHADLFRPKVSARKVERVTQLVQLGMGRIDRATNYLGNGSKLRPGAIPAAGE